MTPNPSKIFKTIPIDEEGRPHFEGVRVSDEDVGYEILKNIRRVEGHGALLTHFQDDLAVVEAFDEPYVAENVIKGSSFDDWQLILPYGLKVSFSLETLTLDPWDRFHGQTEGKINFVFSRKAQAEFFNLLDSFTDDTITYLNKTFEMKDWLGESQMELSQESWSQRYKDQDTPWDMGQHNPILDSILPQLKLTKSRVLVFGSGAGHDAAYFAKAGHRVTALDYSFDAIEESKKLYGQLPNLEFIQADALNIPDKLAGSFDLVFDHTCFCAILPAQRESLIKSWNKCLADEGHLLSIFFVFDKLGGPPFASSEWELKKRLENKFQFLYWTRWKHSTPERHGQELVVYAKKRGQ